MLTLRLTDVLLLVLTAMACVFTVYAILLIRKMNAVIDSWRRTAVRFDEVLPHFQRLCTTTEEAMRSVKDLADRGGRVFGDVAEVTEELKDMAQEGIARFRGLMSALDTMGMLVTSFKAGLSAVQALKESEPDVSDPEGPSEKTDDEKGNI